MEEIIPWPVSLGIAGGTLSLLLTFLIWSLRALITGKFRTGAEFERMEASHTITIAALEKGHADVITALRESHASALASEGRRADEQVANQTRRGDEWKDTALVERAGRTEMTELAKTAVDTFDKLVSKTPTTGDNVGEEVPA